MNHIGGYFELELRKVKEYHNNAIKLNTGRNAFEYILRTREYKKVYLPYYTCDAMLEPIIKLKLDYEFYHINEQLEPIFDFNYISKHETFVYTNYYGIKGQFVKKLSNTCPQLIIDNSQAFFEKPHAGIDTFYSPRKFFGVPDGGYLYIDKYLQTEFTRDKSAMRFSHLIKRIEEDALSGYIDFKTSECTLKCQPIRLMSLITQSLLCNIDYEKIKDVRMRNFQFLHENLKVNNKLVLPEENVFAPIGYPYLTNNGKKIKQSLIQKGIFVATYWPSVLEITKNKDFEYYLTEKTICLPIDQRYGIKEMKIILKLIK